MKRAKQINCTTSTLSFFLFLTMILLATQANAQFCWKKYGYDHCEYQLITEVSYFKAMNNDEIQGSLDLSLGVQKNFNQKYSAGLLGFVDMASGLGGLGLRLTRKIGSDFEFQVTPRAVFFHNSNQNHNVPAFVLETGVAWKNIIGVYSKIEFIEGLRSDNQPVVSLGLKSGGVVTPVVVAVGLAALVAFILSFKG